MAQTENYGIYYTGNEFYPKSADVPAETKKLAESVDNVLKENIENQINEANKKIENTNKTLDNKVNKEDGKELSSNDFTDTEKEKLEGIEENAQINIIEEIRVNGVAQPVNQDKSVNIKINDTVSGKVEISTGRVILEVDTEITNDYEITLPISYTVGNNSLSLFWNGVKLMKATNTEDGHYVEVGTNGVTSNLIRFHRTTEDGSYLLSDDVVLEIVVIGTNTEQGGV